MVVLEVEAWSVALLVSSLVALGFGILLLLLLLLLLLHFFLLLPFLFLLLLLHLLLLPQLSGLVALASGGHPHARTKRNWTPGHRHTKVPRWHLQLASATEQSGVIVRPT